MRLIERSKKKKKKIEFNSTLVLSFSLLVTDLEIMKCNFILFKILIIVLKALFFFFLKRESEYQTKL
jgi:hypothetical protein